MKMFFQFVSPLTGVRSESFSGERGVIARKLKEQIDRGDTVADLMLLVLVDDATDKDWEFSKAPLMKVSTFVSEYAAEGVLVADKE